MAKDSVELQPIEEGGSPQTDDAALQARIQELAAENEALKRQSAQASAAESAHKGRGRNAVAILIALVAAFVLALAVPAVWLNRMVSDTDVYVNTVAPLAEDPDIQKVMATAASDALIEKIDAQNRLEEILPENLQILAVPAGQAVNEFITKQTLSLVQSDQFAKIWETVNRASHKALVTAVTGRDTGAVDVEAGVITLDVGTLVEQVKARLEDAGLGLAAKIPTSGIDKQIVLYESPMLAQMTSVFDLVARIALVLPILGFALLGTSVALAADRRKAVLWLGGAITIAALLPLQALYFSQTYVTQKLYELASIPTPAAQSAFEILFRDLVAADRALVALGIVLWVGAILAGPARWAVAMRSGLSGGLGGVASHLELGRFGVWVRARKRGLRVAGLAVAVVVLLLMPAPRTVGSIVGLAIGYVVWLLLVELFGAEPVAAEGPPEAVEDQPDAGPDSPAAVT